MSGEKKATMSGDNHVAEMNKLLAYLSNIQNGEFVQHDKLVEHCSKAYSVPCQEPICRKPKQPFIQGGTDPLDYIYIFKNECNPYSKHWHYIGLGLSDIYGYRTLRQCDESLRNLWPEYAERNEPRPELYPMPPHGVSASGFGFELTIRVKCNSEEEWNSEPPRWPESLMQNLARYVFQSRNTYSVGDHVAWHLPLDSDGDSGDTSEIRHILMTLDPQLGQTETPQGLVKFIQIVGVCEKELQAAREWNVGGILEEMKRHEETGGTLLVTDMRRNETIFEVDPYMHENLRKYIQRDGSNMVQISTKHKTSALKPYWFIQAEEHRNQPPTQDYELSGLNIQDSIDHNSSSDVFQEKDDMLTMQDHQDGRTSRMSTGSESEMKIENAEMYNRREYNNIYILLSYESAKIIPIMLEGRLAKRRPFSFQSFKGDSTITFIPEGSGVESFANREHPFVKHSIWLQIFVTDELCEQMIRDFPHDLEESQIRLPINYSWPRHNLHITIVDDVDRYTRKKVPFIDKDNQSYQ